jgi:2-polyprenyl-6-methoxyphenol hydroxylase-like FAD-dependent oxidoreductase
LSVDRTVSSTGRAQPSRLRARPATIECAEVTVAELRRDDGGTPLHIVVIGAGVGGLGAALALSRAGHRVTVLERDSTPTPATAEEAFEWDRRGAPQVRHSHALLARLHNLLRDHYPDVLQRLLDAGATEMRFTENLPVGITDREPKPGDEDLVAIACRRTTFEWVLRTTVLAEDHVALLDGVVVDGLVTVPDAATGLPVVTGVRALVEGAEQVIDADVVVAATGRRTGVPRWLGELDIELDTREEDTGIVYLSRFYRLHEGKDAPVSEGPIGGDLGYLKYAVFVGDNHTHSVTFAVRTDDADLRSRLLDPETFDHAARVLPATSAWVQADLAEAITPVHVMGGLLNRRIRYLDPDGRPRILGFHAVGDAHTCTNPLYGRGCSLAMVQADLLAEAVTAEPLDAEARARAFEAASAREIEPWYKASVAQDRAARKRAAEERESAAGSGPGSEDGAAASSAVAATDESADAFEGDRDVESQPEFAAEIFRDGLLPAVGIDAVVFRAFIRAFNLLEAPDALMSDADVIGRVLTVFQDRENREPPPPLGPPRHEMLERLAEVAA